jgi:hypothetical protein
MERSENPQFVPMGSIEGLQQRFQMGSLAIYAIFTNVRQFLVKSHPFLIQVLEKFMDY